MFVINSLRPVKLPAHRFELRIGDNKFENAEAIPTEVRSTLVRFAEIPMGSERGILTFDPQPDWAKATSEAEDAPSA